MMFKNYFFTDVATGEDFIVYASSISNAVHIANEIFDAPKLLGTITDYEAEIMGIDVY